jgi:hypothetical protein
VSILWPPCLKKLLPPKPDQLFLLTTLGMPFKPPLQPSTREYCLVKRELASVWLCLLDDSALQQDRVAPVLQGIQRTSRPGLSPILPLALFGLFVLVRYDSRSLWVVNCQHPNFNTPVEPNHNKGFPRLLTSSHHGSPRLQSRSRDPSMSHSLRALTSHPSTAYY